jgi:RHS repeat-associated protein
MIRIADNPTCIFAFAGRALDKETAVQSNQQRHFDPAVGRWLDGEPIGYEAGDANLHRFVGNRPE